MRREISTVGDFLHIYTRGNRKQPIVRDQNDWWYFVQMLFYFNSVLPIINPSREIRSISNINLTKRNPFEWLDVWPPRNPLVKILSFVLVENHFHLLVKEIREGGLTLFMRKLCTGLAMRFNKKYGEVGRLFQSSYKAKRVESDEYLTYLSVYIQLKNVLERYPGGFEKAMSEFDKATQWAIQDPYSSFGDYAGKRNSPIIEKDVLGQLFPNQESYIRFAKSCLMSGDINQKIGGLMFE